MLPPVKNNFPKDENLQLAHNNLLAYTSLMNPSYEVAKHIYIMAQYLMAVEQGLITRLMIFMPPRHGKCVSTDTIITLADGSKKRAEDICSGDKVLSYKDGKLSKQTIVATESAYKPSIKLRSRTGREITVSHDHPMLTQNGYKKTEDLTDKDFLVCFCKTDFIFDQVIEKEDVGPKNLIHLQVTETQNFIANDFVSHNTHLASENFPAWFLGRNPTAEVMATSYGQDRADDVGRKVRNQMFSSAHASVFPKSVISQDSKAVSKFTTIANGAYYAIGRGGPATGRGANLLLVDDIVKSKKDADSPIEQKTTIDWFTVDIYSRLMDVNAVIIIMTRWNYNDLAGYLLQNDTDDWTVLNLPAIANTENDPLGRSIGDALWPEKYPIERLMQIKSTMPSRDFAALYQQEPIPEEGGLVNIDWFERYSPEQFRNIIYATQKKLKDHKRFVHITISIDTAYKEKQINDPSAFTVWGTTFQKEYFLIEVFTKQLVYPDLKKHTRGFFEKYIQYGIPVNIIVEDKGSGTSLVQDLKRDEKPLHCIAIPPESSKVIRLSEVTNIIESGCVFLPEKSIWLSETETQLSRFPYYRFDDIVDSISQFLKWISKKKMKKKNKNKRIAK